MLTLVLLVASAAPAQVKLASPGLQYVGLEQPVGDALLDRFVTRLGAGGRIRVTTRRDVEQLLGLERQKQLLGCGDTSACLAELASALGADAVLTGSLMKAGNSYTVTLRVVRTSDGAEVASNTERLKDLEALQDWLDAEVERLGSRIVAGLGGGEAPPVGTTGASAPHGASRWPWVAGGVSLALLAGGAISFGLGKADYAELTRVPPPEPGRIDTLERAGPTKQALGVGLMVAGGVGLAASVVFGVLDRRAPVQVVVVPVESGAVVGVQGVLP